ncbi:Protein of unknown function (DUF3074) [Geosmithia morbida]|uniref:DUF3074 domain-containing protein n=1 Tax=Geosmithia morbida TaxID=1094350 RepID=A0A9P4YV50_9HYPO|nr:Protein of unknown function (DUF3074) [Geosmithia morbida]KAF4123390.1 Protein of unknown function (DUF3074) [Geosmithia morbida]
MPEHYGPLVRLWGVSRSQLPGSTATSSELKPLLASILDEAIPFIASVPSSPSSPDNDSSPWRSKGKRSVRHSPSPVHLYERIIPATALAEAAQQRQATSPPGTDEAWILRRSVHEDRAAPGSASWDEWTRYFKDSHAEAERSFTPTVVSTRIEQEWDCGGIEVVLDGRTWGGFTMRLEESVHKMPAPLRNRVFPVLQATAVAVAGEGDGGASSSGRREFIVVQIAVTDQADTVVGTEGNLVGSYTSIERFRDVAGADGEGIEWTMGTASDARGILPAWVQRMSIPGIVAKDVDMFLSWVEGQRKEAT